LSCWFGCQGEEQANKDGSDSHWDGAKQRRRSNSHLGLPFLLLHRSIIRVESRAAGYNRSTVLTEAPQLIDWRPILRADFVIFSVSATLKM
jgi:hypothetical protein